MTSMELINRIGQSSSHFEVREALPGQLEVKSGGRDVVGCLQLMKTLQFEHLSNITCVDWIMENRFDVTYNLWSYTHHIHCVVKVAVDRDNPELDTILALWPHAQVYEQELHEMFGVRFKGNPDQGPLFLHNWQDIPPLRKDFDTEEYSRRVFGVLEEEDRCEY